MTRIVLICAGIGVALLSACSGKQSGSVAPVPDKASAVLQLVPGGLIDACALVPSTDLAALLGDGYDAKGNTVLASNDNEQFQKSGDCKIVSAKDASKIYFAAFVGKDESGIAAKYQQGLWAANNNQVMMGLKTQDQPGVGTAAYSYHYKFGPGLASTDVTLVAESDKRLVTVTLQNFSGDLDSQIGKAKNLATRLLGKL